jgi:hypothetical protein
VNVIRQDADRDRLKRTALLDRSVNLPEAVDLIDKKVTRPFRKNDREKENATLGFSSNVSRHDLSYHRTWWARRQVRLCPPYEVAHYEHAAVGWQSEARFDYAFPFFPFAKCLVKNSASTSTRAGRGPPGRCASTMAKR